MVNSHLLSDCKAVAREHKAGLAGQQQSVYTVRAVASQQEGAET